MSENSEELTEQKSTATVSESTERSESTHRYRGPSSHGPGDSNGDGGSDRKRMPRGRYRKKILDTRTLELDYKKSDVLERFLSRTGKILPRRVTGANAKTQRKISREIKRSRMINLLPFSKRL